MTRNMRQAAVGTVAVAVVVAFSYLGRMEEARSQAGRTVVVKPHSAACVRCHGQETEGKLGISPGIVKHWEASGHAVAGVGCVDCHEVPPAGFGEDINNPRYVVETTWDKGTGLKAVELATKDGKPVERPDIWEHEGVQMVTNVSPRTCALCHAKETQEFHDSRHSSAAQFIGSVDNFLGRFAEGPAAANNGCQQCHGSVVRVVAPAKDGEAPTYGPDVWPNTGMGRVNVDGSWGSCSACHSRHEFSPAVARRPDNCGKCHMGPDHPQLEIFLESKHGIAYKRNEELMNLDAPGGEWVLGKDYAQAPTCSTCHMGPVAPQGERAGLELTHEIGARISWTLRPKVSFQPAGIKAPDGKVILKEPAERRDEMKQVCMSCHSGKWVDNFYVQYDQAVELYNEKYGKPSVAIYEFLQAERIVDGVPMNEEMDYVFFELWHHEGRRARHGASMMGPDFVQWHGFYELTRNFYTHFLPLAEELGKKAGKGKRVKQFIAKTLRGPDGENWEKYHRWSEGLTAEEKETMLQWEHQTYGTRE
ncbi:MAG: multiheme c-type cytochrome [Armatimonadota bacterium]